MINLLPSEFKEELQKQERTNLVVILGTLVFLFTLSLSMLVFTISIYLQGRVQVYEIMTEAQKKDESGQEFARREIRSLNFETGNVAAIQNTRVVVSRIVEKLSSDLPRDFYLNAFTYGDSKVTISGFAPTRAVLIEFRDAIQSDPMFSSVLVPLSIFPQETNVMFTLQLETNSPTQ
jgi:Tfp pilus assembly protein PilN